MSKSTVSFKGSKSMPIDQTGSKFGNELDGGGGDRGELKIFNPAKMNAEGIRGTIFTGEYVSYEEVERKTATGKPFTSRSHKFVDVTDGSTIILNASGLLDYKLKKERVVPGSIVEVSYGGKDNTDRHRFDIIVDPEQED